VVDEMLNPDWSAHIRINQESGKDHFWLGVDELMNKPSLCYFLTVM
jgi:hypothetical protein